MLVNTNKVITESVSKTTTYMHTAVQLQFSKYSTKKLNWLK